MEEAVYKEDIAGIRELGCRNTRIYFGSDLCPELLPNLGQIEDIMDYAKENGDMLTFVTSYVHSDALPRMTEIISFIAKKPIIDEIVVNDLGLLHFLARDYPGRKLVIGRALTCRKSFILDMISRGGAEFSSVGRIEFDSLKLMYVHENKRLGVKVSFYHPYSIVMATRYCPMAQIKSNGKENHGILPCRRECRLYGAIEISNPAALAGAVLKGNSILMRNSYGEAELEKHLCIDRLIHQPGL